MPSNEEHQQQEEPSKVVQEGKPEGFVDDYPEHDKLQKVSRNSQVIGAFLDWLSGQDVGLYRYEMVEVERESGLSSQRRALVPVRETIEQLLARYYEIDLARLEIERVEMLENYRRVQASREWSNKQG